MRVAISMRGREKECKKSTHQTAEAVKKTWLCGHVSWLFWLVLQISWTLLNSHVFIPTCRNAARVVATSCTTARKRYISGQVSKQQRQTHPRK